MRHLAHTGTIPDLLACRSCQHEPLAIRGVYSWFVGLKYLTATALCAAACFAQDREIGGAIGSGVYRNGSIYAVGGKAGAGIRNRFAAGVVFAEDLYDHISGEIHYLYPDGHPFLSSGGARTDMQGRSHTLRTICHL